MRETLFKTRDLSPLKGEISEDGAWINFKLRKANYCKNAYKQKETNKDGKTYRKFRKTKRCIINLNQRAYNDEYLWDSNRTIVAMDYTENAKTVLALNHQFVKQGCDIMCDENSPYKWLDFHYTRWSVNHEECYVAKGINNNLAESFNAHFYDLHRGIHHKCDNKYALHYANQVAFMSDNRQKSNGDLLLMGITTKRMGRLLVRQSPLARVNQYDSFQSRRNFSRLLQESQ